MSGFGVKKDRGMRFLFLVRCSENVRKRLRRRLMKLKKILQKNNESSRYHLEIRVNFRGIGAIIVEEKKLERLQKP